MTVMKTSPIKLGLKSAGSNSDQEFTSTSNSQSQSPVGLASAGFSSAGFSSQGNEARPPVGPSGAQLSLNLPR